jgi:hypothetical protein
MNLSSQALENIAVQILRSARVIKTRSGKNRPDVSRRFPKCQGIQNAVECAIKPE